MELGPAAAAADADPRGHGLRQGPVQPPGVHRPARTWAAWRTCSRARRSASTRARSASARRWIRCWPSRSADSTPVPSLVLGIEPNELRLEDGLSMIYGSSISWVSPTKPATKEIYPSRAFDQLVGDGKGRKLDRSILDAVLQERTSLQPKISTRRPQEARRVSRIRPRHREAHRPRVEGGAPRRLAADAGASRTCRGPANEIPQNVPDHMKLMLDLIVLAFQMDKTRIATLHAEQRPVADELQVPGRRARRAAPGPHAQRPRAGAGGDVPEDQPVPHAAVRLPGAAAEGDRRGRDSRCSTTRC